MCRALVSLRHRWEKYASNRQITHSAFETNRLFMDFTKLSTVAVSSYSLTIENVVALGTILCREAVFWLRIPLFLLEAMMEV